MVKSVPKFRDTGFFNKTGWSAWMAALFATIWMAPMLTGQLDEIIRHCFIIEPHKGRLLNVETESKRDEGSNQMLRELLDLRNSLTVPTT